MLEAQRGPGEVRAFTAIAQAQLNYSDSPDIADWHNGTWESGVQQAPLVQTTFPNAAGAVSVNAGGDSLDFTSQASDFYAWTSRFAGQVAQEPFDDALVTLFDQQSQGTLGQLTVDAGDALSVAINGSLASGAAGLLASDFGCIDFQTADGNSVRLGPAGCGRRDGRCPHRRSVANRHDDRAPAASRHHLPARRRTIPTFQKQWVLPRLKGSSRE